MSIRIVTWNVNGIRNPFSYMPWRENRSFGAMFDILEADVVCFQELKIQAKDLRDDMVLIPGWDSYFTFPKHKKGYSGVAIYTRQAKISPVKAEEGITGHLQPTGSPRNTSYRDLPDDQQIGGYPSIDREDGLVLDSEGRAVVVDFGLFVLIGTYCPVGREEESRQDFRLAWLTALEERIRNLTQAGRKVVTVGDLNISPEPIDSADAWGIHKRAGPDSKEILEWKDTPAKRLLRGLCEPSEGAVMVDVVRQFFPDRAAMYTHWETKINARPGNYGSRIDYIIASSSMKSWFDAADIQNGLHGSDHCPVYAVLKPEIELDGEKKTLLDLVNPPGVFQDGERKTESPPPPRMSARLIPQFSGRRSIKEMFQTKTTTRAVASTTKSGPTSSTQTLSTSNSRSDKAQGIAFLENHPTSGQASQTAPPASGLKHHLENSSDGGGGGGMLEITDRSPSIEPSLKKAKITTGMSSKRNTSNAGSSIGGGSQKSLKTFFQAKTPKPIANPPEDKLDHAAEQLSAKNGSQLTVTSADPPNPGPVEESDSLPKEEKFIDPFQSRDSWNKLFTKRPAPLCEGHGEPAKMMQTKKPGVNYGRSFWMCARPVGPAGPKERGARAVPNDQWRCTFFKWCSEK
ncbi:Class II abasic (AP) endonuclease [Orbilia brochopaga]|uniref:DNA-(apurinic or apyrimidinic site) endonuclease 2 n=1 Tax=Orbilia brochopaga TaxID=3140254 RepID=A0AAV9V4B2_9PEZI